MTSVKTHCIPAGSPWATNQMPIISPQPSTTTFLEAAGGAGNRRGRCIYFPSTAATSAQILHNSADNSGGCLAFQTTMAQDGWQVLSVDELGSNGSDISNDVINDSGYGTRALATTLHYLDHILWYANKNHGGAMPFIVSGYSRGAWNSLVIAQNAALYPLLAGFISRSSPTQWNAYPTDTVYGAPLLSGQNSSGINLVTNANVSISAVALSAGVLTLTTTGSFTGAGITVGSLVTIQQLTTTSPGGTWSNVIGGAYTVQSVSSTTMTVNFGGSASGTYTAGSLSTSVNTSLNSCQVPGVVAYGDTNELVSYWELNTIAASAIAAPSPGAITNLHVVGGGHTWYQSDAALFCAGTYSGTHTYVQNEMCVSGGNAYICNNVAGSTGNTPPNATYWTLIGTQSSQGWVQATLDASYPKVY